MGDLDAITRAKKKMAEAWKELDTQDILQQDTGKSDTKGEYGKPNPKMRVNEVDHLQNASVEGPIKKKK